MTGPADEPAGSRTSSAERAPSATGVPLREADVRGVAERRPSGARRAVPLLGALALLAWARRRRRR